MLNKALVGVYGCASDVAEGRDSVHALKAHMDQLRDVVCAYDTENRALHLSNETLVKELDEMDLTMKKMGEEISFLYKHLRACGIRIPLEGHPVCLEPFADREDPDRHYYEGEYKLPIWFDLDAES